MDWDQRCLRLCAAALLCSVLFRLSAAGALAPAGKWLCSPEAASVMIYLNTGRVVRLSDSMEPPPQTVPSEPPTEPAAPLHFLPEEADGISPWYRCSYRPDLAALLTAPLDWELQDPQPKVLIVHTHTCESYTPEIPGEYEPSGDWRTLDPDYNVVAIGKLVTEALENAGIGVIHDTSFHDYPSYNGSYVHTAASTEAILAEHPSLELVIDIHRDAADTPAGQLVTECEIGGQTAAQIMLVVGTDDCGLSNPHWEENLAVALKLQTLLERENPGICRRLTLTDQRYNQHLGRNALLIEVGAAGNTLPQAKLAAKALSRALIALSHGSR